MKLQFLLEESPHEEETVFIWALPKQQFNPHFHWFVILVDIKALKHKERLKVLPSDKAIRLACLAVQQSERCQTSKVLNIIKLEST